MITNNWAEWKRTLREKVVRGCGSKEMSGISYNSLNKDRSDKYH